MKDKILESLMQKPQSIKLEISTDDLLKFSSDLIRQTKLQLRDELTELQKKEQYLTREETCKRLNVCDSTLWHWNKKQYLKSVKIGRKVMYKQSDVEQILNNYGC